MRTNYHLEPKSLFLIKTSKTMNKIFKLFPVAAAALLLASCNSDDLFDGGSAKRVYNVPTIDVTVEDADPATRANTTGAGWLVDWQAGDVLRVYDASVQKYDNFEYDGYLFARANAGTNPQYVSTYVGETAEENAYALFYGKNSDDGDANAVSYSGWKQGGTAGTPVALLYVPKDLIYAESKLSTDNSTVTYKTAMPLWGRVSEPAAGTEAQFSARLNWLTSYIRLRFENANKLVDPIVAVHVKSLAWGETSATDKAKFKALATADKKGKAFNADLTDGTIKKISGLGAGKNLNGWFEAELKTDGQLVNTTDPVVQQPTLNRNLIDIDVNGMLEANENYLWIPVISGQTYDVLAITYETQGGVEYIANVYFDYAAQRASGKAVGIEFPNSNYILDGTTPAKVTTGIKNAYDGTTSSVVIFNKADETTPASQFMTVSAGAASKHTIYLPQITDKDLTVVIDNDATSTTLAEDLTITDASGITEQGTGKVKILIKGFENPGEAKTVTINSKANVTLAGDFSVANVSVATGDKTTNLTTDEITFENNDYGFNYGAKTLTATKGNLTIKNMTNTGSVNFNNASGTLVVEDDLAGVTVTDATSATIKAAVSTVDALKNVTVNIPYNATPADMTVGTLNIHKGVTAVTLQGGIIGLIKNETTASTKTVGTDNVTVTSSGLSAIRKVTFTVGKIGFTSSFAVPATGAKTMNYFEVLGAAGAANIYTAAQLAAIDDAGTEEGQAKNAYVNAFALKTNITALTNWTSPNLVNPFAGGKAANGLTISGVDAPLFGVVTANISNVDLTVAINKAAATIGGLAKNTAATNVTVHNVAVAGSISAQNKVGGVFGATGDGNVTFGDGANNSTNGVSVNVAFTNKTDYDNTVALINTAGTFGKFVGQAGAGAVTINKECSVGATAFNKSALHFNYNRLLNGSTGVIEWQFIGNTDLIGYSPDATSLTYGQKTYTNAWVDPNAGDASKKLKYTGSTKKVTGTVRIINSDAALTPGWYTAKNAAFKTKINTVFGLGAADDANWDAVIVEVHNLWEAYAQ